MTRRKIIALLRASGKYELFEKELENLFTFELLNLLRKEKEAIKMKGGAKSCPKGDSGNFIPPLPVEF